MNDYTKYLKYKEKYIELKNINTQTGGKKLNKKIYKDIKIKYNKIDTKKYIENLSEPWFNFIRIKNS